MDYNKILARTRKQEAVKLYKKAEIELGVKSDLLKLTYAEVDGTPYEREYRVRNERINQLLNPIVIAKELLEAGNYHDMTVIEHLLAEPFLCKSALESIAFGISEIGIDSTLIL
ncbi:MAG: hypothetical protein WC867_01045 [Candidatus Pacearchaeota archaeon]|jgi:hypothetical protein